MIQYDEQYKVKIGKTIHQYRFDQFINSGAFGAKKKVFKGTDLTNGNNVAIKLVTTESFDNSNGYVGELLLNEINIMKEIENDNVVRFLDYFQSIKFAYIIMEYCDGGNLQELWMRNNQKFLPFEALKIMKQILNGMRGLHEKHVMHRDLKLANILIHEDVIKIADLGFSCRILDQNELSQLSLGTLGLMAPEVAACQQYGLEADVFSVGAIFYQLLYGRLPFDDNSFEAFLYDAQYNKPKFYKIDPNYDDLLQDIISKMLEFNGKKRISFAQIYEHKIMQLQAPRGSLIDKGQVKLNGVDFTKSMRFYQQSEQDKFDVIKSGDKLPVFELDQVLETEGDNIESLKHVNVRQNRNQSNTLQNQNNNNKFQDNNQFQGRFQGKRVSETDQNYIPTPQENSLGEKARAIEEGCKKYLDFYNYIQILIQLSEDLQLVQYKNVYPIMYPRLQLQKFIYFKQYDLLDDIRKKKNMFNLEYIDNILETQEMKYIFERIYKEVVDSKEIYCQNQYNDLKSNFEKCQKYISDQFMSSAKVSYDSDFNKNFKTSMKQLRDYLYNQENNQVKQYDEMLRIILNITNLLNLSDREFKQLYGRVKTMDINSLSKEVTYAIQREQQ